MYLNQFPDESSGANLWLFFYHYKWDVCFVFFQSNSRTVRLSFLYFSFHRCQCVNRKKAVSVFCGLAGLQAVVLYNSSFCWGSLSLHAALKCGCKFMKSRHTSWWVGCAPSQSDLNRQTEKKKKNLKQHEYQSNYRMWHVVFCNTGQMCHMCK